MALAHSRMLIHELLNKDTDIVPQESPLIILDRKYAVYMTNNGKDTNYTRHISRKVNLVRNGEKWKIHKIDWCEEGMQLVDISTSNIGENDLNNRMRYIMVRI